MKPIFNYNFSVMTDLSEITKNLTVAIKDIFDALSGQITFSDNISCTVSKNNTFISGKELAISHNLNIVPVGFVPISLSASATIYDGTTAWTNKTIYLIASANVVADIIVLGG